MGPIHEVTLDIGVPLIATISRQEQEALRLLPGDRVHVNMPGGAFHMLDST
jgi:translation initiation factor IF-1